MLCYFMVILYDPCYCMLPLYVGLSGVQFWIGLSGISAFHPDLLKYKNERMLQLEVHLMKKIPTILFPGCCWCPVLFCSTAGNPNCIPTSNKWWQCGRSCCMGHLESLIRTQYNTQYNCSTFGNCSETDYVGLFSS